MANFVDEVTAHEVAHQWWGHVVGWASYRDQWISEGFATFSAGLYLQGTIYAERRQFREAEAKFCEVVQGPNASTTAFYVDRRYFPVRDLANLGLGRVAHEERRHPHAFYHYFQVPEDSPELPKALFEAAWTMAEHGEYAVARDLVSDLRARYPDTPQAVEAELLDALLKLYDCDLVISGNAG